MLLAMVLATLGCACIYLASPHQRWRASALPLRIPGLLLSLASLFAFTRAMDVVPAVFAYLTWTMLLLVLLPYSGAALPRRAR